MPLKAVDVVTISQDNTDGVTDGVTDVERQLLMLLSSDPGATMPQLAERIGVSRKTIGKYLKDLKAKGIIIRVGSDRSGHWQINSTRKGSNEERE